MMDVITYPCWDLSQSMLVKVGPGPQYTLSRFIAKET